MSAATASGQFGDTTYTKVFVGGLAWETKREAMKNYFDQFGDILEAVVITDKHTGRSKGYGFVTFCEPESVKKACIDPSPVIDGRRANCNLASLGVQRTRPTTPQHGGNMRRSYREMKSFDHDAAAAAAAAGLEGGMGAAFLPCAATTFPHYHHHALQQGGCPCDVSYGYFPYSTDYSTYLWGYYNTDGGGAGQYPMYIGANGVAVVVATGTTAFYPYFQFGQGSGGAAPYAPGQQSYGMQYPHMFQYPAEMASSSAVSEFAAQQQNGGGSMSSSIVPTQTGMAMALQAPTPASHHHCKLIPTHLA